MRAIDFMPPRGDAPDIVRIVEGLDGEVPMRSELVIRFDYGSIVPWVRRVDDARVAIAGPGRALLPHAGRGARRGHDHGLGVRRSGRATASRSCSPGFRRTATLPDEIDPEQALADTEDYWHEWAATCGHTGDYHDEIHQSLLVLKALTYAPTGGIVAAPTTLAPRADRRRAQLGLPLLLAPRRDADAARDAQRRATGTRP